MADFINENDAKPTRLLLRSDTITNWLSSSSTPLMYGEVGVGYDTNGTGVIAKIGSIKGIEGQKWSDAPQLNASVDESGLNLEEVGRVYSSVVVDENNNPISSFSKQFFYPSCSNNIRYLYGNLNQLPYSLGCGTDQIPPDSTIYNYDCVVSPAKNYILPKYLSGWRTTLSVNTSDEIPSIFEAPVGFVHPEFGNVLPCDPEGVIHALPIQPVQTSISVLSWLENVEVWTIPISPIGEGTSKGNYGMQFLGTVSGWFPFPHRQFICDNSGIVESSDGNEIPQVQCQITLNPTSDSDVDTDNTTTDIPGSAGSGEFTVSSQDPLFTCDQYPEYCSRAGICGTCMSWTAQVIQGGNWFRLTDIVRNTSDCEPSTGTIEYEYDANSSINAEERIAVVRVYTTQSVGSDIPTGYTYADFTFTQSEPFCEIKNVLPNGVSVNSNSHTKVFTVRTQFGKCSWNASIQGTASWITILNPTGGYNNDDDDFAVSIQSNSGSGSDTNPRIAYINVTDTSGEGIGNTIQVRIYQNGNTCSVESLDPPTQLVPADTKSLPDYSFDLTFNTEDQVCNWETNINYVGNNFDGWVTITENETGTGSETVSYSLTSNPSTFERIAYIDVLGKQQVVTQQARECTIEKLEDPDTLLNYSVNITGCGDDDRYFSVYPYSCTSKDGCIEEENCSWYVDLVTLGAQYPWITIIGVGPSLNDLQPPNAVINGFGVVVYEVSEYSALNSLCTQSLRIGQIRIVPQTNTSEYSIFTVNQSCADVCACDPETEGCGSPNPCIPPPEGCQNYGPDPENPESCICLCDDNSVPVCDEEGNCTCPNNPPSCFANSGDPNQPGGGSPPGSGTGQNPEIPCGITTWEKIYTIPEEIGYAIIYTPPEFALIDGDFGIIEIDTLKVANSFVKVKGYLNPGVSVVWNDITGLWEPKYVPNFYSNQLTQDGFVYYNTNTNKWEITNIIDGGSSS